MQKPPRTVCARPILLLDMIGAPVIGYVARVIRLRIERRADADGSSPPAAPAPQPFRQDVIASLLGGNDR
jgi:hypothetical protein